VKAAKKKAKGSKAKSKAVKAKSKKSNKKKAKRARARECYTKVGGDPTVTIWRDGVIVGEMSEAEADARGIPPCGG
jgi:hypothetical protein